MRPQVVCLLALMLAVVGCIPGVLGTAEETTEANAESTPANEADIQDEQLAASKKTEGKELESKELEAGSPGSDTALSEVADMMRDPYRPYAVDSDDEKEATVDSGVVAVVDSHVVKANKTHESDMISPPPAHEDPPPALKDAVAESVLPPSPSPALSSDLPEVSAGTPGQASSTTTASGDRPLPAEGTGASPALTPTESVTEKLHPLISTGLSSVSIASVSRSAMSPPTEVAAILSVVLVVSAVVGYLGMLGWRRVLEKRYGNREMLVNEDDDLRNFEL